MLLLACQVLPIFRRHHPSLKPAPDEQIINEHVLDPDRAAIRVAQPFEQFAKRQRPIVLKSLAINWPVHVPRREAEEFGLEFLRNGSRQAKRIHLRDAMASQTIKPD